MRKILYPEWLIDGTGAPPLIGQAVVVEDGVIQAVASVDDVTVRDGDQTIEFPQATLMPGLINSHVHLVLPGNNTPFPMVQLESDSALALQAAHNIETSLRAGVTMVRDCGGRGSIVVNVRDAQARGTVRGAKVISCAWPVTMTGGHERYFGGEADGEDGLRRMVRRIVSSGADFVKVLASGGGTPGSLSQYPSFSASELQFIVEAAHALGRPVAAHCIATKSIENAVEAGVDLIEHGLFVEPDGGVRYDARVAERLAEAGIPVTTTMQVARDMVDLGPEGQDYDRWLRMRDSDQDIKARLRELGVRWLAGSDAGWRATPFDTFWKELGELVTIGMSPVEAIRAATGAVAEALHISDWYGTVQAGRTADMVIVAGNAASDICCVADAQAVFQAGRCLHFD